MRARGLLLLIVPLLLAACAEPAAQPAKAPRRYQANATVLQDRRYGAGVVHLTAALTPAA